MTIRTVSPRDVIRIVPREVIRIRPHRKGEQRTMAPVYVCWTSGVTEQEGAEVVSAVREVLNIAGQVREIKVFGSQVWGVGDFGSADWYQERAMIVPHRERHGYGSQTNAIKILSLMRDEEPWQEEEPHLEVMFVDHDASIGTPDNNFVFGVTWPGFGFVQSVRRIHDVEDLNLRLRIIRRVGIHEFAHILNVPNRVPNTEEKLGRHCTNVCCMRQGLSLQVWTQQLRQEEAAGVVFCEECTLDLRKY